MKKFMKFIGAMLAIVLAFTIASGGSAFAMEIGGDQPLVAASSTIVGPDGNVYTYLGTATRNGATNHPVTATLATTVTASDNYHIKFYCPNNNKKDLVQGTITATPVSSGSTQTYSFLNYFNELADIDLSTLSGTGYYQISISVYAIGSSNQGDVYFRLPQ